jgi:hypothetical protein
LSLGNSGLRGKRVCVVWYYIENLIKFSQRFGKTPKRNIRLGVLAENVSVARVELLGLVEI